MEYTAAQRAHDRRPLGSRFLDTSRQTRDGGGLPESEEGGIPAGITDDLVRQFDLPARKMEREERLLAFNGGDLNATLWEVCKEGGGNDARFLLAHGADVRHRYMGVLPVLPQAASNGHLAVVEALLDAGGGALNDEDEQEDKARDDAAEGGHTAIVLLLLDRGADVHWGNNSALWRSSGNGHLDTVRLLLARGADPNTHVPLEVDETSCLDHARMGGHFEIAELLLAHGALDA